MNCPFCQKGETKVIATRKFETVVLRVRLCIHCEIPFQTQEEYFISPKNVKIQVLTKMPKS